LAVPEEMTGDTDRRIYRCDGFLTNAVSVMKEIPVKESKHPGVSMIHTGRV